MRTAACAICSYLLLFNIGCGTKTTAPGVTKTGSLVATTSELEGVWRVSGIEAGGKGVAAEQVEKLGLTYRFAGDKVTVSRADKPGADQVSTFKLESSASPKRLTMTVQQGPAVPAIYSIEGDVLKLCLVVDDAPNPGFPTEFASKASPKTDLITLKRQASANPATTEPAPAITTAPSTNPPPSQPPATAGSPNERRTAWRYVDAPLIFPGQPTTAGVFLKKDGKEWLEERKDAPTQDWTETERTPEFIEISRPNGGFFVRLYVDHCTYRYGNEVDFKPMFPGKWE